MHQIWLFNFTLQTKNYIILIFFGNLWVLNEAKGIQATIKMCNTAVFVITLSLKEIEFQASKLKLMSNASLCQILFLRNKSIQDRFCPLNIEHVQLI